MVGHRKNVYKYAAVSFRLVLVHASLVAPGSLVSVGDTCERAAGRRPRPAGVASSSLSIFPSPTATIVLQSPTPSRSESKSVKRIIEKIKSDDLTGNNETIKKHFKGHNINAESIYMCRVKRKILFARQMC